MLKKSLSGASSVADMSQTQVPEMTAAELTAMNLQAQQQRVRELSESRALESQATWCLKSGQLDKAVKLSHEALEIDPTLTKAIRTICEVHHRRKQWKQLIERTQELLDILSTDGNDPLPMDWCLKAKGKLMQRDYDGAIEDATTALEFSDRCYEARWVRARAKHFNDDFHGAIEDCTDNIRMDPEDPRHWTLRAMAKVQLGATDGQVWTSGAVADCNQAILLDYRHAEAWSTRGDARNDLGDHEGAVKDTKKALRHDPSIPRTWSNRADALEALGRYKEAVEAATEGITRDELLSDGYGRRGEAKFGLGDINGAIVDCTRATDLDGLDKDAFYCTAKARLLKGHYNQAMERANKALEVDENFDECDQIIKVAKESKRILKAWRIPACLQHRDDLHKPPGRPSALQGAGLSLSQTQFPLGTRKADARFALTDY